MPEQEHNGIITIGITSYNYGHFIGEAVQSVIGQTSPCWKLVIYDNGSTDDTFDVLQPYLKDERVSLVVHEQNIGARNNSIYSVNDAETEFFSFLQADDYLESTFVEKALELFGKYPQSPFVFFDWYQYIQESKQIDSYNRLPFKTDRSGPVFIGPFLSICNFVPLHMAVFRTVGIQAAFIKLNESPLKQVGEQFILKWLEDKYGVGCYSGTVGGAWRRHGDQMTEHQMNNGVALIEEPVERNWYLTQVKNKHTETAFMALVTSVQFSTRLDLLTCTEWLLHSEGQRYAESFGIHIDGNSRDLVRLVFAIAAKFAALTHVQVFSRDELNSWLTFFEVAISKSALQDILSEVKDRQSEAFINADEIEAICNWAFEGDGVTTKNDNAIVSLDPQQQYQEWIQAKKWTENDVQYLAERMTIEWRIKPSFHIVMLLMPEDEALLSRTIDALSSQYYSNWILSVISVMPEPDQIFSEHPKLNWFQCDGREIYTDINYIIETIDADWISFAPPGISYEAHSLATVTDYINLHPEWFAIYSDDDVLNSAGERSEPRFKPDFNLDLLRSFPYIGIIWINKLALNTLSGIQTFPSAENYDLAFRCIDSFGEQALGHIDDVLIHLPDDSKETLDEEVGLAVLSQHLERNNINANIDFGLLQGSYRVDYLSESEPLVSIIIPTKDNLSLLQACIESLFEKTAYKNFEVLIVDNASKDPEVEAYYMALKQRFPEQINVLTYEAAFNFSAMVNDGANAANGEFILLLNNDTEIIQAAWLSRMVSYCQRQDVGVVGAKLIFPETGMVQHAGVVLGMQQVAGHIFANSIKVDEPGYMGRAQLDQNYSAVTAACMLIKHDLYKRLDGFDAERFAILFNDVDFCIRAGKAGYKTLWTPHAMLCHHQGQSLQPLLEKNVKQESLHKDSFIFQRTEEQLEMWKAYMPLLVNDPAYNRNLLLLESCDLNTFPAKWNRDIKSRVKYLAITDKGAGPFMEELQNAFSGLEQSSLAQCDFRSAIHPHTDIAQLAPDTVVFQQANMATHRTLAKMSYLLIPNTFVVMSVDESVYDFSLINPEPVEQERAFDDLNARLKAVADSVDRIIVKNDDMANLCRQYCEDVIVVPYSLPRDTWFRVKTHKQDAEKIRVAWAGDAQNTKDLMLIEDVIKQTSDMVEWIIVGTCPNALRKYVKEVHPVIEFDSYADTLASLDIDLAVYPQDNHPLNFIRSHQQVIQFGALACPVISSDNVDMPVIKVANDIESWNQAITVAISDRQQLVAEGLRLRDWVAEKYIMDDRIQEWVFALTNQPDLVKKGIELAEVSGKA